MKYIFFFISLCIFCQLNTTQADIEIAIQRGLDKKLNQPDYVISKQSNRKNGIVIEKIMSMKALIICNANGLNDMVYYTYKKISVYTDDNILDSNKIGFIVDHVVCKNKYGNHSGKVDLSKYQDLLKELPPAYQTSPKRLGETTRKVQMPNNEKCTITDGDHAYKLAKSMGHILKNVRMLEPNSSYNYILSIHGDLIMGKFSNDWEYGIKHVRLASHGGPVLVAGELRYDGEGKIRFNIKSGSFMKMIYRNPKNTAIDSSFEEMEMAKGKEKDKFIDKKKQEKLKEKHVTLITSIFSDFGMKEVTFVEKSLHSNEKITDDHLKKFCESIIFKDKNKEICDRINSLNELLSASSVETTKKN